MHTHSFCVYGMHSKDQPCQSGQSYLMEHNLGTHVGKHEGGHRMQPHICHMVANRVEAPECIVKSEIYRRNKFF